MHDLDRIRFVTRNFERLQGLGLMVPMGLDMVSLGCFNLAIQTTFVRAWLRAHHRPAFAFSLLLPLFAVMAGTFIMVLRMRPYYRRRFGHVERPPVRNLLSIYSPVNGTPLLTEVKSPKSKSVGGMAVGLALFSASAIIWALAQPSASSWMRAFCVFYGSFFLWVWLARGPRFQEHYMVVGLVLIGLVAPGEHSALAFPGFSSIEAFQIITGVPMVVVGLFDHWQLVRTLGRIPIEALEAEDAEQMEEPA